MGEGVLWVFGFVQMEPWENPGWVARLRCGLQKGYGTELNLRPLFGRTALFVRHWVVDGLSSRQRKARQGELLRMLAEKGVDKVAVCERGDSLAEIGMRRMGSDYLHSYLAGDVGAHVAERAGATAACFFRTVGQLEERALLKLAESFRYLMVSAQRDSAAICRALRRRYGLPVVEDPTPSQVRGADFALLLHPPGRDVTLSGRCLAFRPRAERDWPTPGGIPITGLSLAVPPDLREEIPAGFLPLPILSEAAFRGQIDPSRIKIHDVSIDNVE